MPNVPTLVAIEALFEAAASTALITTRTYRDRLETLERVQQAGIAANIEPLRGARKTSWVRRIRWDLAPKLRALPHLRLYTS